MTQGDFAKLHAQAEPLVLFNIWDAASAQAVERAGAKAIGTGSLALAGAHGFDDGENIAFARLIEAAASIAGAITVPLSVDMESGFASDLKSLSANAAALADAGAAGCNLEDQLIGVDALRETAEQADRIAAAAKAGLFVNARTDMFLSALGSGGNPNQPELVDAAIERAAAYHAAGAGCFFAPGLSDLECIAKLADCTELPLNIMRLPAMASNRELAKRGVARISYGPAPWRDAMAAVEAAAREAFTA